MAVYFADLTWWNVRLICDIPFSIRRDLLFCQCHIFMYCFAFHVVAARINIDDCRKNQNQNQNEVSSTKMICCHIKKMPNKKKIVNIEFVARFNLSDEIAQRR